jgi:hypothetical protein
MRAAVLRATVEDDVSEAPARRGAPRGGAARCLLGAPACRYRSLKGNVIVQVYLSVANRTGSERALELADQLSAWHDEMVVHARAVARGGSPVPCDESCPHARAVELWRMARETLGEAADRLLFLKAAATSSRR